jgi:iron complex outermembrane recepter protein
MRHRLQKPLSLCLSALLSALLGVRGVAVADVPGADPLTGEREHHHDHAHEGGHEGDGAGGHDDAAGSDGSDSAGAGHTHDHGHARGHDHDHGLDDPDQDDLGLEPEVVFESIAHGERSASERRFDAQALRGSPGAFTAEDLLRLVPNLLLIQHGSEGKGQQLFMRGFDAAHGSDVEVTFDDIPINEWSHVHAQGYLDFTFLIPEVILSMYAIKGPIRAEQGLFATAGSVNFSLGVPQAQRGARVSYEVGTTNRHRLLALYAPQDAPETDFLAVEAVHDDGFGQSRQTERVSLIGQQRLWERADGDVHLDLLALGYVARFDNPGLMRLSDVQSGRRSLYDSYLRDHEGDSARALLGLHLGWTGGDHALEGRAYVQHRTISLDENFTGDLLYPGVGDRRNQAQQAWTPGLNLRHHWHIADRWQLTSTARYSADITDQTEDQLDAQARPWLRVRDVSFVQQRLGLSSAVSWAPARWMSAEVGGRLDVLAFAVKSALSAGGEGDGLIAHPSPRASVTFRLPKAVRLFVAYGRGVRPPEARAFAPAAETGPSDAADKDVSAQADRFQGGAPSVTATDSAEVGARWSPTPDLEVGVAGFGTWLASESVFDHVSGLNLSLNATQRLGLEADVTWYPWWWLQVDLDGTYVDARFTDSGEPVPGVPTTMGRLQVWFGPLDGFKAGVRVVALGPRALAFGATAAAGVRVDLSASYRWPWLEVGAQVANLLNTDWRAGEYNFASAWDPSAPRSQLPAIHVAPGPPLMLRGQLSFFF